MTMWGATTSTHDIAQYLPSALYLPREENSLGGNAIFAVGSSQSSHSRRRVNEHPSFGTENLVILVDFHRRLVQGAPVLTTTRQADAVA